jgi:hypothetical protein
MTSKKTGILYFLFLMFSLVFLSGCDELIIPDTGAGNDMENPITAFAGGDIITLPGSTVTFNGSGSSSPNGPITSYSWNFGDGNFGTGAVVQHTYSMLGEYTVTLTVRDGTGASASAAIQVRVVEGTVITSISPGIGGKPGNTVTVAGSGFGPTQGTSKLLFGGVEAAVTGWSETSITATIPAGAKSNATIQRSSGMSNAYKYNVWDIQTSLAVTGTFATTVVDALEIAVDNDNRPVLLYYDADDSPTQMNFWETRYPGTEWTTPVIVVPYSEAGYSSGMMSLEKDSLGNLHLSYTKGGGGTAHYKTRSPSGVWSANTVVSTGTSYATDLALSPAGEVAVVYKDNSSLYPQIRKKSGLTFLAPVQVDSNPIMAARAHYGATDGKLYVMTIGTTTYPIRVFKEEAGSFMGYFPGPASATGFSAVNYQTQEFLIDSNGYPVFTYVSASGVLSLAKYNGSAFDTRTITSEGSGTVIYHDLKMDASGNIYVPYGTINRELRLAVYRKAENQWSDYLLDTLDTGTSFSNGIQMALDTDGFINIAYARFVGLDDRRIMALYTRR